MVPSKRSQLNFPIVCIGSSAGGLLALEQFFSVMPSDSGIAFVIVSHLAHDKVSLLPELIARKTSMEVVQIVDGVQVTPNRVYVIPPNKDLAILNGKLQLLARSPLSGKPLLIDTFLASLAQDCGSRAIGIILSGSGTDGSKGIRALKANAGLIIAQDADSAKHNGMPGSAIDTGCVDFVLPPEKMPEHLIRYIRHQNKIVRPTPLSGQQDVQNLLQKIFILLRAKTNHDFSLYKKNTICRRIERRMYVHQIDKLNDYVTYLQQSEQEAFILFHELLIGVTSFFREPEVFEVLQDKYLPTLLNSKKQDAELRVWVPACSTGEEAYSIAILIAECMEKLRVACPVSIFATDIDENAIAKARAGIYSHSVVADVGEQRLKTFFNEHDGQFVVKKKIREMIIFATQNIIKDPPFINLDILCCRNLLIYFGSELQKKLLPRFHYSLKEGGFLILGSSETIGQATDLFRGQEKKVKLFKRISAEKSRQALLDFPTFAPHITMPKDKIIKKGQPLPGVNVPRLLKAILDQIDVPACVVIDDSANILYIHGRTGRFLEPAEGQASMNLLDMARPGLKFGLAAAIRKVATDRKETELAGLEVKNNNDLVNVNLIIKPLPDFHVDHQGLLLIIFDLIGKDKNTEKRKTLKRGKTPKSDEVKRLEEELHFTRENLQTTIEELETSNEELKSTNEELQSTNEELQSTNEELETSKEELQSLNEESVTVNSELQSRIDDLVEANDDIKNLLDATHIATIFLDTDINIRRFTSQVKDIFPLTEVDVGRSISHFTSNLKNVDLQLSASEVLRTLEKQQAEVVDNKGRVYRMKLKPFRTSANIIDGVVITFEEITDLKRLLVKEARLAAVVKCSSDAITLQDFDGNIIAWNKGAEQLYGYSETEALTMNINVLIPPDQKEAFQQMNNRLRKEDLDPFMAERLDKSGNRRTVWLTITKLMNADNSATLIATTERDMSKLA